MNFFRPEQRQMHKSFDRLCDQTVSGLAQAATAGLIDPTVHDRLLATIDGCFVPNITDRKVTMPKDYRGRNGDAVIPVAEVDKMYDVTDVVLDIPDEIIAAAEKTTDIGNQITRDAFLKSVGPLPFVLEKGWRGFCGHTYMNFPSSSNNEPSWYVRSRNVIGVGGANATDDRVATFGHEVLHALDSEPTASSEWVSLWISPQGKTRNERRAHSVSFALQSIRDDTSEAVTQFLTGLAETTDLMELQCRVAEMSELRQSCGMSRISTSIVSKVLTGCYGSEDPNALPPPGEVNAYTYFGLIGTTEGWE